MIITPTKLDSDILEQQLLRLVKEKNNGFANVSELALQMGLASLTNPISINKALLERAIDAIRDQSQYEQFDRWAQVCQDSYGPDHFPVPEPMRGEPIIEDFGGIVAKGRDLLPF